MRVLPLLQKLAPVFRSAPIPFGLCLWSTKTPKMALSGEKEPTRSQTNIGHGLISESE
jgi:hypothetical protein